MKVAERLSGYRIARRDIAGEFLDEVDEIAFLSGGISKLRELILDFAVRGKLVSQDDSDEPAFSALDRVKQERIRLQKAKLISDARLDPDPNANEVPYALPTGWIWTRLSILGEISPRNDVADDAVVSFLPMVALADGFAGTIAPEQRRWGEIKKGFTHIADGDVALAKITPCFQNRKSAVIRGLTNGVGAGTTELHVFRSIGGEVLPDFVLLNIKCLTFLEIGVSKMTGSAGQKRVPRDYFAKTPFPLPPLAEQHRIVAKVDGLMRLCDELEAKQAETAKVTERSRRSVLASLTGSRDTRELSTAWRRLSDHFEILLDRPESLADLRQTILTLAVQGKLVKQDPNDEPASDLLKRVATERHGFVQLGKMRQTKPLPNIASDEVPFSLSTNWQWDGSETFSNSLTIGGKHRKRLIRELD